MVEPQKTILVVDDTAVDAAMIAGALKDHFKSLVATSGDRALILAKGAHKPNLILLDVMMEGLDGHEVRRRLKADPVTRDVPVIFLTAKTDVEDEKRGFELGAVATRLRAIPRPRRRTAKLNVWRTRIAYRLSRLPPSLAEEIQFSGSQLFFLVRATTLSIGGFCLIAARTCAAQLSSAARFSDAQSCL